MRNEYNDDLFEDSKMTFGQHLEELRVALFKSIIALLAGFLIGLVLPFLPWGLKVDLVAWVQGPLQKEMRNHYRIIGLERYQEYIDRQEELKQDPLYTKDEFEDLLGAELLYSEVMIDPQELVLVLQEKFPGVFDDLTADDLDVAAEGTGDDIASPQDRFIPLRLYTRAEDDPQTKATTLKSEEAFTVYIKASLIAGLIFASPFIFFFIWDFVAAGLYPHERRYVYVYLPFSLSLFLAGAALAFFVAIRYVLSFLFTFNRMMDIDPQPQISSWLNFVLILPVGFGVAFQLPLVMLFLERIGVVTVQMYVDKWRISVLVIAILSMVLTPSDPGSMLTMFIPLTVLYFGGILLCRLMPRSGANPFGEPID